MQIKNTFKKDLFRQINGVIKVGDETADSVWQELDEYVVTKELSRHFVKFFNSYLQSVDDSKGSDSSNRIGVWVSGFFGSGKSHFIKIIAHLLRNQPVTHRPTGESRRPIEFFENKIQDPFFLSEIKRAVNTSTDVLLFNIDSKAGSNDGRDAILKVFMRVLNELQGFSSEHPHLAEIELSLELDGKYEAFQAAYERIVGKSWKSERHTYRFRRKETVGALTEATGMSEDAAEKLIDETRTDYNLNVENFAQRVKEYLDRKGPDQRIIFVADEVGQFIGTDTHLMLNLQTIVETLGTVCGGRAWVVVTSQEDMEAVLGNVVGAKSNDFSKIQGRFPTRLSLSSSNTDEVIQARLLEKTETAESELKTLFRDKGDVLKNQLSFSGSATLNNFRDAEDFSRNYPFAPYHYKLVQSVFESIRKAGATGLHLARGERSMLDAFQMGAKSIAADTVGKLVPFYAFYPSVESFLDTAVARTITQAGENEGLEPFDADVLRILFLIRYVEIVKPNIENLVTLCITEVDADRISLKKQLESSLSRLEKQHLINRNGDLYYFLTNEERDVKREIGKVDVTADETLRHLGDVIFGDLLIDAAKYRYPVNKKDFAFNRFYDGRPYQGINQDQNLNLEIITPLNDEHLDYTPQRCVLSSDGRILVRLGDQKSLSSELREFLQTKRYIQQKSDASAPESTRRILSDKAGENQQRGQRIREMVVRLIEEADIYASGQQLSSQKRISLADAQQYLVSNTFTKLGYLNAPAENPLEEIRAVLLADLVGQQSLGLDAGLPNSHAIDEIRNYVTLRSNNNMRVTLEEITKQFERQPFGWRDHDTALLTAKLFAAGELSAKIEQSLVEPRDAIEDFVRPGRWKNVQIVKRRVTNAADLSNARDLAHRVFAKLSPDTKEDDLAKFIRDQILVWQEHLRDWRSRSETGDFPGFTQIKALLELANGQNNIADTFEFFRQFNEKKDDWLEASENYAKLSDFYHNQIEIWRRLRAKLRAIEDNRPLLELEPASSAALRRMGEIIAAPEPYGLIKEIDGLIASVNEVNEKILKERREQATQAVESQIVQVKSELDAMGADAETRNKMLTPFQEMKKVIEKEQSIQRIAYQQREQLDNQVETVLDILETKRAIDQPEVVERPIRTIKPALFATKTYLESQDDVDQYLNKLRTELERHLAENARVRIH